LERCLVFIGERSGSFWKEDLQILGSCLAVIGERPGSFWK
jgi:hypothetical protein